MNQNDSAVSLSDLVVVVVAWSYLPFISSPKKDLYIMLVVPFIPYCFLYWRKSYIIHTRHRTGDNLELSRESSNADR